MPSPSSSPPTSRRPVLDTSALRLAPHRETADLLTSTEQGLQEIQERTREISERIQRVRALL